MLDHERKDFIGKWTIYEVGNATWAKRLQFGAKFEIAESAAGAIELKLIRGFADEMKKFELPQYEAPKEGDDKTPHKVTAHFPDLNRIVVFTVTRKGEARMISMNSGDEGNGSDHDHTGDGSPTIRVHGGPHGVDD